MIDFLLYALLVGIAIALISGPLGALTVWRKMAYFGDTLAHSALIGVALGLFLEINMTLAIMFACGLVACLLVFLENKNNLSADTLLGVLSHGSLALGLICVSIFSDTRINIYGYLFGDFLTVTMQEVFIIYSACILIAITLIFFWRPFLMLAIDEDLSQVEGANVNLNKIILMFMISVLIALAMKIVGVMLITALLIVPAASARKLSSSPEAMALLASVFGIASVFSGIAASYLYDIPAGPAVVSSAIILFLMSHLIPQKG